MGSAGAMRSAGTMGSMGGTRVLAAWETHESWQHIGTQYCCVKSLKRANPSTIASSSGCGSSQTLQQPFQLSLAYPYLYLYQQDTSVDAFVAVSMPTSAHQYWQAKPFPEAFSDSP